MDPSSRPRPRLTEPGFLVLAALALADFLFLSRQLHFSDFILNYPVMGGDSHDWLANGLYYAGHDVRFSARPPLVPLVLAVLDRFSALGLYPVLAQALVHVTMLGLYRLLRRDYPSLVAFAVSAAWLLNGTWQRLSLSLMADVPAACLLAWSVYFWRGRDGRPRYVPAGLCAGLSAVTQQLALLWPVPVALAVVLFRRRDLAAAPLWVGGALFALPTLGWLLAKKLTVGTVGDVLNRNWSVVHFHTDSFGFYSFVFLAFVGLPAAALMVAGLFSFLRRPKRDVWSAFLLSLQATILIFFVVLYDYNSARFLAYVFPLSAVLAAEGMVRLRRPAARAVTAALIALWALAPLPGYMANVSRIVLWPAPVVYLETAMVPTPEGAKLPDPFAVEVEVPPVAALVRHNLHVQLARLRREPVATRGLMPEEFRDDRWAVYFYDDPLEAGDRYGTTTRLGNLLLKRVQYVPYSAFDRAWRRLRLRRLGEIDRHAIYRARIPGLDESWIVAVPAASAADRELRYREVDPLPPGAGLGKARKVAALAEGRSIVIIAPASGLEPWQVYLPFLVATPRLYVIEPEREPGTRRMLGEGVEVARFQDVVLMEHHLFGWTWTVIGNRER